jgi:hypothetical protein
MINNAYLNKKRREQVYSSRLYQLLFFKYIIVSSVLLKLQVLNRRKPFYAVSDNLL